MAEPVFYIKANGKDVTSNLLGVLTSMTVTDNEGLTADTLELEIDDVDGLAEVPETGAILQAIGGYEGNLRDYGLFSIDNVSLSGWPQRISVSAQAVTAKSLARHREPKSYPKKDFPTYGDIFKAIAGTIGAPLSISSMIAAIENTFEAQADEDGLELMARLEGKLNASITIKQQRLIVVEKGAGLSATGNPMERTKISRPGNLISYNVMLKDSPRHKEVEASYYERGANKREIATEATGMDGPKYLLRWPYQNKDEAQRAARSKATDLVMAQAEVTFDIEGDPHVSGGAFAEVSGVRNQVDGLWKIKSATHAYTSTGHFNVTVQCETPANGGVDG